MPKGHMIGKPKKYTIERLEELRRNADLVGDTDSRDKITARIVEMGGSVAGGVIPEDESKVGRLMRLRQNALDANDTDSAEKIALLIAEAQGVRLPYLPNLDPLFQAKESLDDAIVVGEDTPEEIAELRKAYEALQVSYAENGPSPANPPPDWVTDELYVAADALRDAILANEPLETLVELRKAYEAIRRSDEQEDAETDALNDAYQEQKAEYDPAASVAENILALAKVCDKHTSTGPPDEWWKCWTPEHLEEFHQLLTEKAYYGKYMPQSYLHEDGLLAYLHGIEYVEDVYDGAFRKPQPPVNGGMNVHAPQIEDGPKTTTACPMERVLPPEAPPEPQGAPESDKGPPEGATVTQQVNDGTASINAAAKIKKEGYKLSEIYARFGGRVDIIDLRSYMKMLTEGVTA